METLQKDICNFNFNQVYNPELAQISRIKSLDEMKNEYERQLEKNPSDWQLRERLAFLYAQERSSRPKRWNFNFEKAETLLIEGLKPVLGGKKLDKLDHLLKQHERDIIFNPLDNALDIISEGLRMDGIELDEKIRGYIRLKKRKLTSRHMQKESRIGIPRGEILTDQAGGYWCDPPIEDVYQFHISKGCKAGNSIFLRLVSLMRIFSLKHNIKWGRIHFLLNRIPKEPESVFWHPDFDIRKIANEYFLRFTPRFLQMSRREQNICLSKALKKPAAYKIKPGKRQPSCSIPFSRGLFKFSSKTKVLLLDFHGLSMGVHVVNDTLLNEGIQAEILTPPEAFERLAGPDNAFYILGISLSDRGVEKIIPFLSGIRKKRPGTPIIIGGSATLQYKALFSIIPGEDIYIYLGDSEKTLPGLIALLEEKHLSGKDISEPISRLHGLLYRTYDCVGIIRPDIFNQIEKLQLFLPKVEFNKSGRMAYTWNPNRGCPKRCAFCNNVQGKWKSSSLTAMKAHMLATAGHLAGFNRENCRVLGGLIGEKIESLQDPAHLQKSFYPESVLEEIIKVFAGQYRISRKEVKYYFEDIQCPAGGLSRAGLFKALLILNGLGALRSKKKGNIGSCEKGRVCIYTASDNFLVETAKIIQFYDWLIQMNFKRYFVFRTQTSLDFLWDFHKKRPNKVLIAKMLEAGVESLGFGYDSSANAIGRDVLKHNTYNMMIKLLDAFVMAGYKKENIRIHHFYSSPVSSFSNTLEGLLLKEAHIANDRGNMIAMILYTHRSEMGMLCKMNFENCGTNWLKNFKHIPAGDPEYSFLHSEASLLPMLDGKAEQFLKKLFFFNTKIQEFETTDTSAIFAPCFKNDINRIIRKWCSSGERDPEIMALGRLIKTVHGYFPGRNIADVFGCIKRLCIRKNIFSFERILDHKLTKGDLC